MSRPRMLLIAGAVVVAAALLVAGLIDGPRSGESSVVDLAPIVVESPSATSAPPSESPEPSPGLEGPVSPPAPPAVPVGPRSSRSADAPAR